MNYSKMALRTAKMITKYGASVSMIHTSPGTFNPVTGSYTSSTTASCNINILIKNPSRIDMINTWIDGTLIEKDDKEAIVAIGSTLTPSLGDYITLTSVNYSIVGIKPLEPGLVPLLFNVLLRK